VWIIIMTQKHIYRNPNQITPTTLQRCGHYWKT